MTASTVETAGEGGDDGGGLRGSEIGPSTQAVLGRIMARKRPNYRADEQKRHLRTSQSVVELLERSTKAVGHKPSGKSRL